MFFDGGPLRSVPAPVTKARTLMRPVGGLAVLAFLLWRLGSGPFLDGLRLIDSRALAAALGIGVLTTVCCAWRWRLVAGGLGVRLPLRTAVAHCYRSVFLNATLPGGVLGDVHRGVRHGRDVGDVGRGIRAVVWERSAGQVVQVAVALVVLCAFPSPVRSYLPAATALLVAGALGTVLLARALPRRGPSRWARALRTAEADVRAGHLARRRAGIRGGRRGLSGDVPGRGAHRRRHRATVPPGTADGAGAHGHAGAGEHRRLRAARRRGRMGVRRRWPDRRSGRRHRDGVRGAGARREPSRRRGPHGPVGPRARRRPAGRPAPRPARHPARRSARRFVATRGLTKETNGRRSSCRNGPDAADGAAAVPRRIRYDRARVLLQRVGGRPGASRAGPRRPGGVAPPAHRRWARATGPPAQRVPDRRRVRQPAVRLRPAAARGGGTHRGRRRLPAVPAAGGARHRPVPQARRVRVTGHRPGHLRGEPGARSRRGRARLHRRRPDARRPGGRSRRSADQQPGQGGTAQPARCDGDRAGADRRVPVPGQRRLPGRQGQPRRPYPRSSAGQLTCGGSATGEDMTTDASPEHTPGDGATDGDTGERRRWRRVVAWVTTALACLLVLFALIAPNRLSDLTPGAFLRIPVEGLVGVALVLVLPERARRVATVLVGVALGLLTILKLLDMGFHEAFDRPFHPALDGNLLVDAVEVVRRSFGRVGAIVAVVVAVAVTVGALVLMTLSVLRLSRLVVRHRTAATRTVAVLGVAWVACAVLGVQIAGVPLPHTRATPLPYDHVRQVSADLRDPEVFAAQLRADPFADTPSGALLTALHGKDVILTFVESYGRVAIEDREMAPQVGAVLDAGNRTDLWRHLTILDRHPSV